MVAIVGILNITPDSFSDGGKFDSLNAALEHVNKLIDDGADMIDIGAESTRPTATPISTDEEWSRLQNILPEILKITKKRNIKTAIDSYHFANIKKAHELGVDIINDVKGLEDERIIDFIVAKNITTILMHNEKVDPIADVIVNEYLNLTRSILDWGARKINYLQNKGVNKNNLIFDVGIGFGKNAKQSVRILKYIKYYKSLGLPLYVGHSKKSFLAAIDFDQYGRDLNVAQKTLIISKFLIDQDIDYLRVHEVKEHYDLRS